MPDHIPRPDGDFNDYMANLCNWVAAHLADVGLVAADIAPVEAKRIMYEATRQDLVPAQAAAQSARAARDTARKELEVELRKLIRRLQASPQVSDAEREAMGITVPSTSQTATLPDSKPVAELEKVDGLQHVLRLTDSETGKRTRPRGATGIEVRMAVVPHGQSVPATPDEMPIVGVSTANKWVQPFTSSDVCKTAAWGFRYVGSNGQKGPWSTVVSGTIAA